MTTEVVSKRVPMVIVTYRDVYSWAARFSKNEAEMHEKHAAIVRLNETDMKEIGVIAGRKIRFSNGVGSVEVMAILDSKCPKGFAFMPLSYIPNQLTNYEPGGLPNFKWIDVTAEAVTPLA